MLRPGKRFHFVPSSRSMSPIKAHCSYWFVFSRDHADWEHLTKRSQMKGLLGCLDPTEPGSLGAPAFSCAAPGE
jgi:hypothetical protein